MSQRALIVAVVGLWLSAGSLAVAQVSDGAGPKPAGAAPASSAHISGKVVNPGGSPIPSVTVRARDLLTGQLSGSASTSQSGQFLLSVNPGSYILEVVDTSGQVIGTSSFILATAGSAISAATVTATTGVLGRTQTSSGLLSTLGTTAARSVTYAAAAAGVAGIVTPGDAVTASPSR